MCRAQVVATMLMKDSYINRPNDGARSNSKRWHSNFSGQQVTIGNTRSQLALSPVCLPASLSVPRLCLERIRSRQFAHKLEEMFRISPRTGQ